MFTTVYQFGENGLTDPSASKALTQAPDGSFYGVSSMGGASIENGSVFHFIPNGALTVIYSFGANQYPATGSCAPGNQDSTCLWVGPDAQRPSGKLTIDAAGNLIGLSANGGAQILGSGSNPINTFSLGTIYELPLSGGQDTVEHSFYSNSNSSDGAFEPGGSLTSAPNGLLYGIAEQGGASDTGSVFSFDPTTSAFTTVYSFGAAGSGDGAKPFGIILGSDGNLYGVTYSGGTNGNGTVFRLTLSGTETVLYSFGSSSATDGANPAAALVIGSDGAMYGSTRNGGAGANGTIFRITTAGAYTSLYSFGPAGSGDGANPGSPMVLGLNGTLYGTTLDGGTDSLGTVFKVTNSGTLTVLYSFTGGNDGQAPGDLTLDTQTGYLWGTTAVRGQYGSGTIFMMSP